MELGPQGKFKFTPFSIRVFLVAGGTSGQRTRALGSERLLVHLDATLTSSGTLDTFNFSVPHLKNGDKNVPAS